MISPLLEISASLLALPTTPLPLRRVAARAILTALEEDVPLPVGTVRLAWDWITSEHGFFHAADVFAALDDEHIRSTALSLLLGEASERSSLHLVETVLTGSGHAHRLDDATLANLIEHATTSARAEAVAAVLRAVQSARGLPPSLLRSVRDKWAAGDAPMRAVAIEIAFLEEDIDTAFVDRVLRDPATEVRQALADTLRRQTLFDRDSALAIDLAEAVLSSVRDRARIEMDREVRGELYRAVSAMEHAQDGATYLREIAEGGCDPRWAENI